MELDQVGDDGHERRPSTAALDRLPADVVEERVDRDHDVRRLAAQKLDQDLAHPLAEDGADDAEGEAGVAAVVNGTPGGPGALDERRVQPRQPADDARTFVDERVGSGYVRARLEQPDRLFQGGRRGAMAATGVGEEDQDPVVAG
jgi:hypothetical protein